MYVRISVAGIWRLGDPMLRDKRAPSVSEIRSYVAPRL